MPGHQVLLARRQNVKPCIPDKLGVGDCVGTNVGVIRVVDCDICRSQLSPWSIRTPTGDEILSFVYQKNELVSGHRFLGASSRVVRLFLASMFALKLSLLLVVRSTVTVVIHRPRPSSGFEV